MGIKNTHKKITGRTVKDDYYALEDMVKRGHLICPSLARWTSTATKRS
jgi:hypothetical protein